LKKQFTKNLSINIFAFISNVLIGLWLTPYLIKHLGIVAYGLIPLAMFFSQYIGVILNSINMSINRFLLIALQQNNDNEANKIFSTSIVIISIFIFIQALIMLLVLVNLNVVFTIPESLLYDATWLFGFTFVGFSISLLRSVYGTSLFAYNRLDILRIIDVVQNISRIIIILMLFYFDKPSLMHIGLANLIASILAIIMTYVYFKKYTPNLKAKIKDFDKNKVAELSKMSSWILINQVGALLLGNIDLYLVNKILGTEPTGNYAVVTQVTTLFRTLATLIAGVISPVIMIYHANNQIKKLKSVIVISAKFMVILLVVPMALFIGFSEELIGMWLGIDYKYLYMLISFSLLFYVIAIPMMPLYNVNIAFNKVKTPAIIVIVFGFLNMISIYILLTYSHFGLWGVVFVKLFFEILFAGVFMPIYVSGILSIKVWKFLSIPLISIILFLTTYYLVVAIKNIMLINSLVLILVVSVLIGFFVLMLFLLVFIKKEERVLVFQNISLKMLLKK
jgi:membrane protein EpsK